MSVEVLTTVLSAMGVTGLVVWRMEVAVAALGRRVTDRIDRMGVRYDRWNRAD